MEALWSFMQTDLGLHHLGLFVLAGWALNLTPGPDVFYMVTSALRGGWRSGLLAVAGISAGCLVHVLATTLGLGALLATSATAFTLLKWVGAAYLVWMGLHMLRAKPVAIDVEQAPSLAPRTVFVRGFLSNALNPKVALFFVAFLPQFIHADAPLATWGFALLGVLFTVNALPIGLGYVALAAWLAQRRALMARTLHGVERMAGLMLIGFGAKLALAERV
jgi:threonine/homoserine/homoserine lactone efflux protein